MAATERPIDSLLWASQYIKNMPIYRVQTEVLNDAARYFWRAAPWRWTLGNLTTVTLVNNTQDYTVTLPTDFEYAVSANLINAEKIPKELEIVPFIPLEGTKFGQPGSIAITGEGALGNYRFSPVPNGYTGTLPLLTGSYKRQYTKLTETTIFTAGSLIFPDVYIDAFRHAVLYYAYKYADDQRAGNIQVAGKNITYTGQRAEMEAAIEEIRQREPMPLIDVQTAQNPKKEKG
ncbi:hypothetical protein UFOVP434_43 [uncultured Caudovirales phage]|uniref:Uncharacterized protein n=1 Tax=uncultured Caudovirales phage TaxID=2100421 RepID=A0A6J5MC24_9CAUD|nr:hypothetical protein UFOVP434_43 [uncultured Caudovirales phage]